MKSIRSFCLFIMLCHFISCKEPHDNKDDILALTDLYDRYILSMNTDSIASIYAIEGNLGDKAHGRDSIARFLNSFSGYKVLFQKSTTDSLTLSGDKAFQTGMYTQTTVVPPHDTVQVRGRFNTHWIWTEGAGWKIKRMDTEPIK